MKRFLTLSLFLFIAISSFGQLSSGDYTFNISFYPSFHDPSNLSIQVCGDSALISVQIYNHRDKKVTVDSKVVMPAGKFTALNNFLKTYKFRIKNNIDTVGSHKEFVRGDSVLVYVIEQGNDGVTVKGVFNQNSVSSKFAFWSPNKGTENTKLMVYLFDLIYKALPNQKVVNYSEQLQQYFPHNLGLKKLSDNPLTYKLFGSISVDEADQFHDFLEKLPLHRKVVIDMSNYEGMGTIFYGDFEEYHINRKNIYWRNPTLKGLIDLYKQEVSTRQILSKKKLVVTKKDGQEIFSIKEKH